LAGHATHDDELGSGWYLLAAHATQTGALVGSLAFSSEYPAGQKHSPTLSAPKPLVSATRS
jgi:hypothetical protein